MPRIAAALAVLATTAFSIGFNVVRYPVVWDQLAAIERLSQSTESTEPADAGSGTLSRGYAESDDSHPWGDHSEDDDRVVASISGGSDHDGYDESWNDEYDDSGWDDGTSGADSDSEYSYSSSSSNGEYSYSSSSSNGDYSYSSSDSEEYRLHSDGDDAYTSENSDAREEFEPVASRQPDASVRRLPSVSDWEPSPHAGSRSWSQTSIPAYPSTGRG